MLALTAIFLVFGAVSSALMVSSSRNYEQEVTQQIHWNLAQHVVDHYLLYRDGKPDFTAAKETFHDLMILGANFEFYLLDKFGTIVAFDSQPNQVQLTSVNLEPIVSFLNSDAEQGYVCGDDPKNEGVEKIFSVAPILQMGETYGYLYVVIGSHTRDVIAKELWNSKMLYSGLWIFIGALAVTLIALLVLITFVTRPLNKLTQQVQVIRESGFSEDGSKLRDTIESLQHWQGSSTHDIHILGHTLCSALEKLEHQYTHVVSIDDLRKELLSHVSHDLRTPLASLLGYLETWELQQDTITQEKSEEYISTAKRSAQKIASLIEQLFELAHLDGANVTVKKEPVAVAELVQDVLQKFAIQAQKRQVSLDLTPKDSSIIVRADIEKLERVFTNLIENALRHTQKGGSITVRLKQDSALVSIEVSDTGIGIPEADIPHIFDAHFKAGNSIRENTAHGGLGLAITKKLLELHESAISVRSEINEGTSFHFALPSI